MRVALTPAELILELIQGATIATGFVEDEEGIHIVLQDGRVLIVVGDFAISLIKTARLH